MLAIPYPRKAILFVLFAIVAVTAIGGAAFAIAQGQRTANVEVRVWEDVNDPERNFISARPEGGSWSTLGTIRLPLTDGVSSSGRFRYGDITLAVPLPDASEAVALPRCLSEQDRFNRFNYNWFYNWFNARSLSDLLDYAARDFWEYEWTLGDLFYSAAGHSEDDNMEELEKWHQNYHSTLEADVAHVLHPLLAEGNPDGSGTHNIGRHSLGYLMGNHHLPERQLGGDEYWPPFHVDTEELYSMSQGEYDRLKEEAIQRAEDTADRLIVGLASIGAQVIYECQLLSRR